jgi:hypothetical protein
MSTEWDLQKALNKGLDGIALGAAARGDPKRLTLTPTQAKDKILKGKLFRRDETATYKLGKPERPLYEHDNGFLGGRGAEKRPLRKPTEEDKKAFRSFFTYLETSVAMCNDRDNKDDWFWQDRQRFVRECGGNLPDANLALRNFLFGKGKSRTVDYERYLRDEDRGSGLPPGNHKVVRDIVADFIPHAEAIGLNRQEFSITSKNMYAIGNPENAFTQGPVVWNWRRTLGSHVIWISATVTVRAAVGGSHMVYEAQLTFHIEDIYNFNPGKDDGRLNIRDEEGGKLELSGLGTQFLTFATLYRKIEWNEGRPDSVKIGAGTPPPGTVVFKEDHVKEEEELVRAQQKAGVWVYPIEVYEMAWKGAVRIFTDK